MVREDDDDAAAATGSASRAREPPSSVGSSSAVAGTGSPPPPPPPPLPPRRHAAASPDGPLSPVEASALQAKPTTALSSIDIQTVSFPDGSRGTFSTSATRTAATPAAARLTSGYASPSLAPDSMSLASFAPTMRPPGDLASLVAGQFNRKSRAWMLLHAQSAAVRPFDASRTDRSALHLAGFDAEFDDVSDPPLHAPSTTAPAPAPADDDDARLARWTSKLKHYMVLSSAGKPIWSRHGDLSLINSYMGVVQTIISFYEGAQNPLRGFTAGNARFVIATEGPLYFMAISRLGESDAQLRDQLRALYMQILSTLTLPALTTIFANRPSTDLRKPLQGTESLLSSLADTFTRGSPSALLGALECLRLRKSQRHAITNLFLKQRSDKLLYGLIAAAGKLVTVIRPRKHSLHPSDLQLIFNMLFESGGVKAGGGENWIPLCLPAFNNSGYLYMYVSFFDQRPAREDPLEPLPPPPPPPTPTKDQPIAIILISPDKESFFHLKEMRDKVAHQLTKHGYLALIRAAAKAPRPRLADVAPGSQISHFLYKSRPHVQFAMSALDAETLLLQPDHTQGLPSNPTSSPHALLEARRRLMTLYHRLHAAVHARHSHLKVLHSLAADAAGLAWITPLFEFYCVAGPNIPRAAITQAANKIVQWAKREEERLFIIGGGVF